MFIVGFYEVGISKIGIVGYFWNWKLKEEWVLCWALLLYIYVYNNNFCIKVGILLMS